MIFLVIYHTGNPLITYDKCIWTDSKLDYKDIITNIRKQIAEIRGYSEDKYETIKITVLTKI